MDFRMVDELLKLSYGDLPAMCPPARGERLRLRAPSALADGTFFDLNRMVSMEDRQKLAQFVEQYSERGYQFAYGLCGSGEEAKELVQEAFCRVFKRWELYDPAQPMENWFLRILRHVYVDSVKRYERRCGLSLDASLVRDREDGLSLAETLPDTREDELLDGLSRRLMIDEVRRALAGLRPDYKAILTLFDLEGMSYEDIAEVMDCPIGTVRSRLSRARVALKTAIVKTAREVDPHAM